MISVLRHRGFRNLWLGQAISQFGDACYYVIFMFMAQKLSGSAEVVGFVGAIEMLPFLLVGPYGGVLADRFDRKKIMFLSDILSGFTLICLLLAVVVFQGKPPIGAIYITAFTTSCFRSVFLPAKSAAIPNLVPEEELYTANSLSYMTQSWMPMIGLALSASVIGILYSISETWFFASAIGINALSFFVSALYIAKLPKLVPIHNDTDAHSHPWKEFVGGLKYLWSDGFLRALTILTGFMSLMISPFFVAYVEANKQWFGNQPSQLAWFEFTFFAGLLAGGVVVAKMHIKKVGIGFAFGMFGCGASVAIMAIPNNLVLFMMMNFLAGICIPFADIPVASHMQAIVEDGFRGRVNSTLSLVRTASMPLGLGLAGTLISKMGLANLFYLMGFGMIAVAIVALLFGPFRSAILATSGKAS